MLTAVVAHSSYMFISCNRSETALTSMESRGPCNLSFFHDFLVKRQQNVPFILPFISNNSSESFPELSAAGYSPGAAADEWLPLIVGLV